MFKKGPDANRSPGGARKGAGRKPDQVKLMFQKMLERSGAHKRFEEILRSETDKNILLKAYQIATERAFGKVPQPISGEDGGPLTVTVVSYAEH